MLLPYHPAARPMAGKVPAHYSSSAAAGTQPRMEGQQRRDNSSSKGAGFNFVF